MGPFQAEVLYESDSVVGDHSGRDPGPRAVQQSPSAVEG